MTDIYDIYAVRYGHHFRHAAANFVGGDPHDAPMPLDYFVWVIRGENGTYLFDTGFDAAMAAKRKRDLVRPVEDGLRLIGITPDSVREIILSHLHFDHCGNHDLFPNARYHLQDVEMAYCTGRCMCHPVLRQPFEAEDVTNMVRKLYEGRVVFHDGVSEIAPNLIAHRVGGHSKGLQILRVLTRRGWVVLGSDAAHFYANVEEARPFPVVESITDMLDGYETMKRLASSPRHIIPGHDPLVLRRYPLHHPDIADIVRLDLDALG
ncbi:N-acyl homoserine lactonase family protein [Ensifer soli]|uniref:N-acyl homoserine lactonase family protein n=1 Tax=Ciceribacter sp. sgz301302 TaxID=3342379 RepID=UPI0035B7DDC5